MELNRNQYFMIGLVVLFLGIQVHLVDSYVLTESSTKFLAEKTGRGQAYATARFLPAAGPVARKVITPPEWLGWALMSVGSVLVLHSLAMNRPSG